MKNFSQLETRKDLESSLQYVLPFKLKENIVGSVRARHRNELLLSVKKHSFVCFIDGVLKQTEEQEFL
jgi:hypothetical protein